MVVLDSIFPTGPISVIILMYMVRSLTRSVHKIGPFIMMIKSFSRVIIMCASSTVVSINQTLSCFQCYVACMNVLSRTFLIVFKMQTNQCRIFLPVYVCICLSFSYLLFSDFLLRSVANMTLLCIHPIGH